MLASYYGNLGVVRTLLEGGADINAKNKVWHHLMMMMLMMIVISDEDRDFCR